MSHLEKKQAGIGHYRNQATPRGQAEKPRVLKVRLLGAEEDCAAAADQLARGALEHSAPRPNRREFGVRVYLTLLISPGSTRPGDRRWPR